MNESNAILILVFTEIQFTKNNLLNRFRLFYISAQISLNINNEVYKFDKRFFLFY